MQKVANYERLRITIITITKSGANNPKAVSSSLTGASNTVIL